MTGQVLAGVERRALGRDMRGAERLGRSSAAAREKVWKWARCVGAKRMLVVTVALAACGPPDCTGWNGGNFLEVATRRGTARCVKAGMDVQARDNAGNAPLHRAAGENSNPAVVEALLRARL